MKQKHFIDSHKGVTGLFVLAVIYFFHRQTSPTAWVYFALHGTYGLLWVLKSRIFGDKTWEQKTGIGYGLVIWGSLSLYWIAPVLIGYYAIEAGPIQLAAAVMMFGTGVFYHFASDMQKHTSLQLKPGLITTGLWSNCRNPNYFGEMLIYGSFALLAFKRWDWVISYVPFGILLVWIFSYWTPNMIRKDKSLSRYPDFAGYRKRSKIFIPFII